MTTQFTKTGEKKYINETSSLVRCPIAPLSTGFRHTI